MTHQTQPKGSLVCGQTCVAILANVGLLRAIYACSRVDPKTGRRRYFRQSSEHDLRAGLLAFGLELGPFVEWTALALFPRTRHDGRGFVTAPRRLLVRVRYESRPTGYHWSVIADDVHDPSFTRALPWSAWWDHLQRVRGHITSVAEVRPIECSLCDGYPSRTCFCAGSPQHERYIQPGGGPLFRGEGGQELCIDTRRPYEGWVTKPLTEGASC